MKVILAVLLLLPLGAFAYPDFIGYGYTTCMGCHFNGQGGGPLNDYGRALFATEIASRALYSSSMSDDDLGNQSGFLGTVQLPYWFRPHFKNKEIYLTRRATTAQQEKYYFHMQQDFGVTLSDEVGKYVAVLTYGKIKNSTTGEAKFFPREYYLRAEVMESLWVYVGLLEKVFGIRNNDHSSFQRSPQGFNPMLNSRSGIAQSEGIVVQKIEDTWDIALNAFTGNPNEDTEYRHKGFSGMGEFDTGKNRRLGASVFSGKSDLNQKNMAAIHYRQGLSKGSALQFEYGYIEDENTGLQQTKGSYNLLQTVVNIRQGYNLKFGIERYNREFKPSEPDLWRYSLGIWAFPLQRLEIRAEAINGRSFSDAPVNNDDWTFQGLVNVSL